MGKYSSGEEDAEIRFDLHEFDVLFTQTVLEHMAFIKDTHLQLDV
jgi:hypothetical protein